MANVPPSGRSGSCSSTIAVEGSLLIRFGDFELSAARRELRQRGAAVGIQPKALELLLFLVRHRARVVPEAELLRALWPDAVVTSASLARALKEARHALEDDGVTQRWIRTHRGAGYRFVGEAVETPEAVDAPDAPIGGSPYVGRGSLLESLETQLAHALAGAGSVALLDGPAGMGKTRTAAELARQAARRGARVLWIRCAGTEDAPSLWPWLRALGALELPVPQRAPAAEATLATAADRLRSFAAIADRIERAAARGPLLLIVEDLHEADAASAALLGFLAPELVNASVLLCVASRPDALERRPELARERARLLQHERVMHYALAGLDSQELAIFVAQRAGAVPPDAVLESLRSGTDGNPLWVEEVLRRGLGADPKAASPFEVAWEPVVARGFGQLLHDRVVRLSPETRSVLEAAAILGEDFDYDLLAAVADQNPEAALAEARSEGLIRSLDPVTSRLAFVHKVFREALSAATPDATRAQLHARAARALEAAPGDADLHVEAIARHWLTAGAWGEPERAASAAQRAAARAMAAHAWSRAAQLFEQALALCAKGASSVAASEGELWLGLGQARTKLGDRAGARIAAERAAAWAQTRVAPGLRAEAALLFAGPPFQYRLPDPEASALLADAANGLRAEHQPLLARLFARRAAEHVLDPDVAMSAALRRDAVDSALSCGDAEVLAEVLMTPYSGIWEHVSPERRLGLADACVDRAAAQDNRVAEARGRILRLGELLGLGDVARFDAEIDAAEALTVAHQESAGRYQVLLHRCTRALAAGDLTRSERLAEQTLALGRRAEIPGAFELFAAQLTILRREQGRLGELATNEVIYSRHPSPAARALRLWGLAETGHAAAREVLAAVLEEDLPNLCMQPTGVANAAVTARACFLLEEAAPAQALVQVLEPFRDRVVLRGTVSAHGPAAYFLALLAWRAGRESEVTPLFERAQSLCRRMGATGWGAQVDLDAAGWRAQCGEIPQAREFVLRAERAARATGMSALSPQAAALRARLG